jgi:hypothetical protein
MTHYDEESGSGTYKQTQVSPGKRHTPDEHNRPMRTFACTPAYPKEADQDSPTSHHGVV